MAIKVVALSEKGDGLNWQQRPDRLERDPGRVHRRRDELQETGREARRFIHDAEDEGEERGLARTANTGRTQGHHGINTENRNRRRRQRHACRRYQTEAFNASEAHGRKVSV